MKEGKTREYVIRRPKVKRMKKRKEKKTEC